MFYSYLWKLTFCSRGFSSVTELSGGQLCPDLVNTVSVASLASGSAFTFSVTNGSYVEMSSMDFQKDFSAQPNKQVVCEDSGGSAHCPEGYLPLMSQCYKLFGSDGNVTYTEAEYFCNRKGGHIMSPSNPMQV